MSVIDRRSFLIAAPLAAAGCATAGAAPRAAEAQLRALCASLGPGNRLGVAVVDTGAGAQIGYQADSRFALCSTFKAGLAAAILEQVDAGRLSLDLAIPISAADLTTYAPVTRAALPQGSLTVSALSRWPPVAPPTSWR